MLLTGVFVSIDWSASVWSVKTKTKKTRRKCELFKQSDRWPLQQICIYIVTAHIQYIYICFFEFFWSFPLSFTCIVSLYYLDANSFIHTFFVPQLFKHSNILSHIVFLVSSGKKQTNTAGFINKFTSCAYRASPPVDIEMARKVSTLQSNTITLNLETACSGLYLKITQNNVTILK